MKANPTLVVMFKPQFEQPITALTKLHTIRPPRLRQIRPGTILSMRVWTGKAYYSKTREFHRAPFDRSEEIHIFRDFVKIFRVEGNGITVHTYRTLERLDEFARADGFTGWTSMLDWFLTNHGLPFTGCLIHWQQPPQV